jgi:hypothetical protein
LLFGATFVAGLGLYISLHVVLGLPQLVVSGAIVLVMAVYAFSVAKVPKLRVRLDQAGDNAYYLGLLFTLISMAFALYEFGVGAASGSGVEQIVANFGIALSSTIAGIFLRVILHQMRVDPADVESMTRIDLSHAAKEVLAKLNAMSLDLMRFHDEVHQRTADVVGKVLTNAASSMNSVADELSTNTKSMLATTGAAQQDVLRRTGELTTMLDANAAAAAEAVQRLRGIEPPPPTLSKRLQKLCDTMEVLGENLANVGERLVGIESVAANAITKMGDAGQVFDRLGHQMQESQATSAQQIAATVNSIGDALKTVVDDVKRNRDLFEDASRSAQASTAEAVRAQEAATVVLDTLTRLTRSLAEDIRKWPPNGE